jgi:hypothetical protein
MMVAIMFQFNIKFAAIACVLVALLAFAMHYDHMKEKVAKQEAEISERKAKAVEIERVANLTEQARVDATNKLEAAKDEIKKRDDCIASGECKRVVRIKSACLPQAEAASGIAEGFAELDPIVQRAASDFEIKLAEQESKLSLCLAYARTVSLKQD